MSTRVRQRSRSHITGLQITKNSSGTVVNTKNDNCILYWEQCTDVNDAPGIDHNFETTLFDGSAMNPINGVSPYIEGYGSYLQDWYPTSFYSSCSTHVPMPDSNVTAGDFAALRARTNPSRPVVTPLTLLQDVVELPKMLKDAGRLMNKHGRTGNLSAKDIANQNLAVQFGWMPLVHDLQNLLDLQRHMHLRAKELNRLYQKGGLKRRIRLGSGTAQATVLAPSAAISFAGVWNGKYERISHFDKWGTIRWKPTSLPPWGNDVERQNLAIARIVSGFTPEGLMQGAWDVVPWTWLLDWFTNAGDFLLTHSNFVPAESTHACVMTRFQTTTYYRKDTGSSPWLEGGDGVSVLTTKRRNVGDSLDFARVPFIGLRRLSILGSLFIQKFK
ncbi:MAG: putative maturation protein [Alehxovirus allonemoriscola]|uniref:Maturation protein n=1 Tax=Leviviridae sp. TaxID=2027243 RepID=A0ABY3STJ8_9VIRU|nr:MAG: putative maturation protein [Leviviridae sp.]